VFTTLMVSTTQPRCGGGVLAARAVGFLIKIPILWTIRIIVLIIGLVLLAMGSMGRAVGGRKHYY